MTTPAAEREIQKQITAAEKQFDNSDYARGLKTISKVLAKHPDHAEAKGLKALFLNALKKKEEAAALIQEAVRAQMTNPKIWKFKGIIHKSNGEYTAAAQSLTMAHKRDPKDTSVLQDLCNLYLFERNYKLFQDMARTLLKTNTYAAAIVRYAIALELNGKLEDAHEFLLTYERNLMPTDNDDELVFRSELSLHHADLFFRMGRMEDLLSYVTSVTTIRDSVSKMEWEAKALIALNRKDQAITVIEKLIEQYPEDGDYFGMLETQLSGNEYIEKLFHLKNTYKSRYAEVRILELMEVTDERFEGLLSDFLVPYLKKGTPAIFVYLEELSQEKLDVAVRVARAAPVPMCYIPIVHNFVADVFIARGDYDAALTEVEAGIEHTPSIIELMGTKIRIFKKMGRISEAVQVAKDLSMFDPADRNTNTTLVNALLANGELKEAVIAGRPFAIDHNNNSKLFQTQYNELCLRCGDCCVRAGDAAKAAIFFNDVVDHFEAFRKSQFNYLGWGMKKTVSLWHMLKWADDLVQSPVLARAVVGLMKIKFAENKLDDLKDIAIKMTGATCPEVLAFTTAYFCKKSDPLPALKCFIKVKGDALFAAGPVMAKMMADLSGVAPVVKEVATELYKPFTGEPQSVDETIMAARGQMFIDNIDAAKALILKAAAMKVAFKQAVELYNMAKFELKDDSLATNVEAAVHTNYPKYELIIKGTYEVPPELPTKNADDE